MGKLIRLKREKRLKTIRREMVEPIYDKKNAAKLAIQEAALAATKPLLKSTRSGDVPPALSPPWKSRLLSE
ncbi:hypothetical protein AAHA92_17086 [Salvia divinorum]|uniref:Uncharacterized protein n=1 Tax=Salvia divinorum TaxID=28513 RepID=A0ABD1GXL5_SALDI